MQGTESHKLGARQLHRGVSHTQTCLLQRFNKFYSPRADVHSLNFKMHWKGSWNNTCKCSRVRQHYSSSCHNLVRTSRKLRSGEGRRETPNNQPNNYREVYRFLMIFVSSYSWGFLNCQICYIHIKVSTHNDLPKLNASKKVSAELSWKPQIKDWLSYLPLMILFFFIF